MPPFAVRVTLPLSQNVVGPEAVMLAVGAGLTPTFVAADVAVQPLASVTVTLNEPLFVTLIDCVLAPFDQAYVVMPAGAVSVTLPPAQNVVGPEGVMVVSGGALTVTRVGADVAEQLFGSVMVTEYEPVFVTTIDGVLAPLDQA